MHRSWNEWEQSSPAFFSLSCAAEREREGETLVGERRAPLGPGWSSGKRLMEKGSQGQPSWATRARIWYIQYADVFSEAWSLCSPLSDQMDFPRVFTRGVGRGARKNGEGVLSA